MKHAYNHFIHGFFLTKNNNLDQNIRTQKIVLLNIFSSREQLRPKFRTQQECIPVGCVPPTCCPYLPAAPRGGGTCPGGCTCSERCTCPGGDVSARVDLHHVKITKIQRHEYVRPEKIYIMVDTKEPEYCILKVHDEQG